LEALHMTQAVALQCHCRGNVIAVICGRLIVYFMVDDGGVRTV
jgi:hypothetical protein